MLTFGRGSAALRAIAQAVVPESSQMNDDDWHAFHAIINHALAQRPAKVRRQIALFVRALNIISYFRYGRALHKLTPPVRAQFLHQIENSRLLLVRRGFWGVRTLVFMGYYARPDAMTQLGYRAQPRGWQAREQVVG